MRDKRQGRRLMLRETAARPLDFTVSFEAQTAAVAEMCLGEHLRGDRQRTRHQWGWRL